jgi:glycosyltransferase involved in cell wall biosynthesis
MKIAMFTDYFYPELGGIQDSIATVSRALGRRGHVVDIHAPRYGAGDYRRIGAAVGERDLGGNVRIRRRMSLPFPSSTRQSRAALPSPAAWVALAGRARPDVIHSHSFFGIGLEALLAGAWLGIPVIGTNHTTIAGFAPHIPVSVDRAAAYVMWYYNRCDHVTAPSRSVFEELGPDRLRRPHRVVSNPIDIELFTPAEAIARDATRDRFGLSGPTITYAGRLGPEKNIDVILHAMAALRDQGIAAELAIAGHGSHEPVLRVLAAELRIAERVRFLGTLAPDDLARLLQISDIFAMMSTSETQSMVLLQAMASGVPVVAANTRALPEFVGPANGVLVDSHDSARLAAAFAELLAAPDLRRRLGSAGRRSAETYGVETVTDAWEVLYRSVLDRGHSRERAKGDQFRRAGV